MAANRGTITITASVLPDDIKKTISGQIIYDLNDFNEHIYLVKKGTISLSIKIKKDKNHLIEKKDKIEELIN